MTTTKPVRVAIVHDYVTQMGGAERVVLTMARCFPEAPIYTSVYEPATTFPGFRDLDIRPIRTLNALRPLRKYHRLGLPLYASAFARMRIDADVVICSSSGWAHGIKTSGRKIVYCYTPARWLYQPDLYLREAKRATRYLFQPLRVLIRRWDQSAARSADKYLAISQVVRERIRECYGTEADVLPPPLTLSTCDSSVPVDIEPGYYLVVSRLLPYKNIDSVIGACMATGDRLAVVGAGPDLGRLRTLSESNVRFLGSVSDGELRWLYANSRAIIAAAYEDFGLGPLEANAFGIPVLALRSGGYLDTVLEGTSGLYFDHPSSDLIAAAIERLGTIEWDRAKITAHADSFNEATFCRRLREATGVPPPSHG